MFDLADDSRQFVIFRLDTREYAIPIEQTIEVLRMVALTPLPEAPAWLPGMMNLRGQVIPVIDVRVRLGLRAQAPSLNTAIIVACVGEQIVGLIVDDIVEIRPFLPAALMSPGTLLGAAQAVAQVAQIGARLIIILNMSILHIDMECISA